MWRNPDERHETPDSVRLDRKIESALGSGWHVVPEARDFRLVPMLSATDGLEAALIPKHVLDEVLDKVGGHAEFISAAHLPPVTLVLDAFYAWTPVAPLLVSTPLVDIADQWRALVADLLRPPVELADEVARWMHAALTEAAEHAHAVLCTDPDGHRRKTAVKEFAVHWIGVGKQAPTRREAILEAVEDVLLSACWRSPDAADLALGARLRSRVYEEARGHRPIWENRVRGYAIDQLERPIGRSPGGELVTLAQRVPDARDPYTVLEGGLDAQRRLRAVMPLLKPEHRRVVLQHAHEDGLTWQEAALRAGLPPEMGESARRRLGRLSQELRRRLE